MNLQSQPLTQQSGDLRSGHNGNLRLDDSGDLSTLFNVDLQREESTITGQLVPTTTDDLATRDAVADEEARIPTHQNPLVKGGVVVAGVSALVSVAAYLYLQSNQPQAVATKPTSTSTPQLFESKTVEGGDVKAELALSKQRQELSVVAANQTPTTATPNSDPAAKQSAAPATPTATPAATPIRPYTPPPQVIASRPVLRRPVEPPAPTYTDARVEPIRTTANIPKVRLTRTIKPTPTVVAAVTVSRQKPMLPIILSHPKPPLLRPTAPTGYTQTPSGIYRPAAPNQTPTQTWHQQATAGTFGGRFGKGAAVGAATTVVANPTTPAVAQTPTSQPLPSEQFVIAQATAPTPKIIVPGARVIGQILNPIQLAANDTQGQTIIISLVQPLTSNDGKLALPAGATQIAFKINALDNGWVRGVSDKVYVNGQELAVPAGSFTLTSQTGEPLVLKSIQFGNDEIAAQNRTSFIYGALQNVGSVLTQPNTQSTVSSGIGGFSSSSSSQSNPNILGAVLQGGFNPLAQQQTQRSQAEIQQLLKATRLWFLPQGTNVQISVNQPLTVSLPPS